MIARQRYEFIQRSIDQFSRRVALHSPGPMHLVFIAINVHGSRYILCEGLITPSLVCLLKRDCILHWISFQLFQIVEISRWLHQVLQQCLLVWLVVRTQFQVQLLQTLSEFRHHLVYDMDQLAPEPEGPFHHADQPSPLKSSELVRTLILNPRSAASDCIPRAVDNPLEMPCSSLSPLDSARVLCVTLQCLTQCPW